MGKKLFLKCISILMSSLFFVQCSFADTTQSRDEKKESYSLDFDLASSVLHDTFFTIPKDLKNIISYPVRKPKESLWALGIIGALVAVDKPVTEFYQEKIENNLDFYELPELPMFDFGEADTDSWLIYGIAANYMGGLIVNSEKAQATALLATKSMAYSFVFAQLVGKTITGRNRPVRPLSEDHTEFPEGFTDDPYDFGNWHSPSFKNAGEEPEGSSMPSFHVTMLFSVAKVYQEMYDNTWIPYSVAAVLFASNIKGHNHWVSDMVAGALLGTMIGHEVVNNYKQEESKYQIVPIVDRESVSLNLVWQF